MSPAVFWAGAVAPATYAGCGSPKTQRNVSRAISSSSRRTPAARSGDSSIHKKGRPLAARSCMWRSPSFRYAFHAIKVSGWSSAASAFCVAHTVSRIAAITGFDVSLLASFVVPTCKLHSVR